MGFFDDVVKVATNVVNNPIPVLVGGAVGGAVAGPIGGAIGTAAGVNQVAANAAADEARKKYVDGLNGAIADARAAKPDYVALEKIWMQINVEAFQAAYKDRYKAACPSGDILSQMIAVDVEARRKSLSEEQYRQELDNIHKGAVEAAVKQLEHERDNPEKQDTPAGVDGYLDNLFSQIANGVGHWLEDRFKSNFEGAGNESGFGAKLLRGGTGISWEDLKSRGLLGGDNSYLRKIVPTWSDGGGVFGGENSFFRKPFG